MSGAGKPAQECAQQDLSAGAGSFLAIWCAPIALGLAGSLLGPPNWTAGIWSIALGWMGAACLLNARRCGRLHCYFSGPILIVGAALSAAHAVSAFGPGANGLFMIASATLGLAALTFALEGVWGKYARSRGTDWPRGGD